MICLFKTSIKLNPKRTANFHKFRFQPLTNDSLPMNKLKNN